MSTDSDQMDASVVLERLNKAIEANGDVTDEERMRLIVIGVTTTISLLIPLQKKVNKLESKSIVIWIERHPKAAGIITTVAILFAMFVHQITPWVVKSLEIITKLPH